MKFLILLSFLFISFIPRIHYAESLEIDSLLVVLETTMHDREEYDNIKKNKLFELKKLKTEGNLSEVQLYEINKKIIKEYSAYCFDSILVYIEENQTLAKQLGNADFTHETTLELAYILASSGHYKQAEDLLTSISSSLLNEELTKKYLNCYVSNRSGTSYCFLIGNNSSILDIGCVAIFSKVS